MRACMCVCVVVAAQKKGSFSGGRIQVHAKTASSCPLPSHWGLPQLPQVPFMPYFGDYRSRIEPSVNSPQAQLCFRPQWVKHPPPQAFLASWPLALCSSPSAATSTTSSTRLSGNAASGTTCCECWPGAWGLGAATGGAGPRTTGSAFLCCPAGICPSCSGHPTCHFLCNLPTWQNSPQVPAQLCTPVAVWPVRL